MEARLDPLKFGWSDSGKEDGIGALPEYINVSFLVMSFPEEKVSSF